jgi:hypothetical protein
MAEPVLGDAKYLVLHFSRRKLEGTKVCSTWRGAQMSKANHMRRWKDFPELMERYQPYVKILSMDAILAEQGIEYPGSEFTTEDLILMKKMGLTI